MSSKNATGNQSDGDITAMSIDRKIELYRRIREHEDNVKNQRMTWMWTLQGLLFTAFSLSDNGITEESIKPLIALAGLISSVSIGLSLVLSNIMLNRMQTEFEKLLGSDNAGEAPFLNIILGKLLSSKTPVTLLLPWNALSVLFAFIWAYIFTTT